MVDMYVLVVVNVLYDGVLYLIVVEFISLVGIYMGELLFKNWYVTRCDRVSFGV